MVVRTSARICSRSRRTSILPASIFSTSRMSLISRISRSVFCIAIRRRSCPFGGTSPTFPPSISPSAPRMEVSGVRSSWLTVETKSRLSWSSSFSFTMSSCSCRSRCSMLVASCSKVAASTAVSRLGARSPEGKRASR